MNLTRRPPAAANRLRNRALTWCALFAAVVGGGTAVAQTSSTPTQTVPFFDFQTVCAAAATSELCIAARLELLLLTAPPGQADAQWTHWLHTAFLAQPLHLAPPKAADVLARVASADYSRAIRAMERAFAGVDGEALTLARQITVPQAAVRALLAIAAAQTRGGRTMAARSTLTDAAARLATLQPATDRFVFADEIARAQARAGDTIGAAATMNAMLALLDTFTTSAASKALTRMTFAGGLCVAHDRQTGIAALDAGLGALSQTADALPPVVRGTFVAAAARGFGACGDAANAARFTAAAIAVADELPTGQERVLILASLAATVAP